MEGKKSLILMEPQPQSMEGPHKQNTFPSNTIVICLVLVNISKVLDSAQMTLIGHKRLIINVVKKIWMKTQQQTIGEEKIKVLLIITRRLALKTRGCLKTFKRT